MSLFVFIGGLAAAAILYVTYFGLVARPSWCLYAYLLIWMLVPKALRLYYVTAGAYDLPEGITAFHIIEAISVLAIMIALIKHRKKEGVLKDAGPLRRFGLLFLITGVFSMSVSFGLLSYFFQMQLQELWNFLNLHGELQYRLPTIASMVYGVVFLYGCIAFVTTMQQFQRILLLFLLLGVVLGLECMAFYYLPIVSPAFQIFPSLTAWSVNPTSERFGSLIFTNVDEVGLFSIIAVGCCLYFGSAVKKQFLLLLPIVLLPVFAGFQRSVLLGVIMTVMFFLWHILTGKKRAACVYVAIALVALVYLADYNLTLINKVGSGLGGSVRSDYFSSETLENRIGLQLRAIELIIYSFPFGVGPGMTPLAMNSPIQQTVFGVDLPQVADYSANVYQQVATGLRTTNAHNSLIEFVVEEGLLGILVLLSLFYLLFSNFRSWLKSVRQADDRKSRIFLAQACVYALFVGIGLHEMFESTFFPYPIYFMFLYFTFLIPSLRTAAVLSVPRQPYMARTVLAA